MESSKSKTRNNGSPKDLDKESKKQKNVLKNKEDVLDDKETTPSETEEKETKKKKLKQKADDEDFDVSNEEENSDESEEDNEYEIENIVGHKMSKGKVVKYEIKWKDYPEEDNTMERAESIHDDASELCEKYWDEQNIERPSNAPGYGKKNKSSKVKKGGKRALEEEEEKVYTILDHVPRCMIDKGFVVPKTYPNESTDWEEELKSIAAVQLSPVNKTVMLTYIEWTNGQKTIHTMEEVHGKSPEHLIDYYEARLRFV